MNHVIDSCKRERILHSIDRLGIQQILRSLKKKMSKIYNSQLHEIVPEMRKLNFLFADHSKIHRKITCSLIFAVGVERGTRNKNEKKNDYSCKS